MKTTIKKSGKKTFSAIYIIAILSTTMGFAQTENTLLVKKSDMSSTSTQSNPLYQDNQTAGEMPLSSGSVTEPAQVTKQKTKSNNTNERTTRPNGQDDGNPFPPKSQSSKGKPQTATYDVKANKKV